MLITHVAFATGIVNPDRLSTSLRLVLPRLDVGVPIFFILSGLLIGRPFVRSLADHGDLPDLRTYARRRVSRIYPLYWVVLAATLIVSTRAVPSLWELLGDVTLLHIYNPATAIGPITQSWSLATEVSFYLFFPLWCIGLRWWFRRTDLDRAARIRAIVFSVVLWIPVALVWRLGVVALTDTYDLAAPDGIDERGAFLTWLPNHLDTFGIGVLLAIWIENGRVRRVAPAARALCYAVAAAALWVSAAHLDLPPLFTGFDGPQTLWRHWLYLLCAAALVLPSAAALGARGQRSTADAAASDGPWVAPLTKAVTGAALASYGVYLWHQLVTEAWFERRALVEFVSPFLSTLLVVLVGSTVLAAITYWLVERPAGDLGTGRLLADSGDSQALGRHPELDGLRGLAVLAVLGTHIVFLAAGSETWALRGGFLGVDVFLVLSGFLIGSVLIASVARSGSVDPGRFAGRRAKRLLPALLVFLAIQAPIAIWLGSTAKVQAQQAAWALTFTANWQLSFGVQPPYDLVHLWSLSLEAQFYVLMAVLVFAARRWLNRSSTLVAILVLASVAVALWRLQLYWGGVDPIAIYERTDARADSMLLGLAAALVWRAKLLGERTVNVLGGAGAIALGLAFVFTSAGDRWLFEGGFTLIALAAAFVVLAVTSRQGWMTAITSLVVFRWFGTISYSLYLWHLPVFLWTVRAMPDAPLALLIAVAFPAAVLVAWLSFQLVERRTLAPWRAKVVE